METTELIKKLELIKNYIHMHRIMDSIRILTLIINDLKLEIENGNKKL